MITIRERKALQYGRDYAPKHYTRAFIIPRRAWAWAQLIYAEWQIGNSDAALYKMHAERDQVNDGIKAELQTRLQYVEYARALRAQVQHE